MNALLLALFWCSSLSARAGTAPGTPATPPTEAPSSPGTPTQAAYWSLRQALQEPGAKGLESALYFLRGAPERAQVVSEFAPALAERAMQVLRRTQTEDSSPESLKNLAAEIGALKEICGRDATDAALLLGSADEKVQARLGLIGKAEATAEALVSRAEVKETSPDVEEGWKLADAVVAENASRRTLAQLGGWTTFHRDNENVLRAVLSPLAAELPNISTTERRLKLLEALRAAVHSYRAPALSADLVAHFLDAAAYDHSPVFARAAVSAAYALASDSRENREQAIALLDRERRIETSSLEIDKIDRKIESLDRGQGDLKRIRAPDIPFSKIPRAANPMERALIILRHPYDRALWLGSAAAFAAALAATTSYLSLDIWFLASLATAAAFSLGLGFWYRRPWRGILHVPLYIATAAFIQWAGIPAEHNHNYMENPQLAVLIGTLIALAGEAVIAFLYREHPTKVFAYAAAVFPAIALAMGFLIAFITHGAFDL